MSDETLGSFEEFYELAKGAYVTSIYLYYQNTYTDLSVRVQVERTSRTGYYFYVSTERTTAFGSKRWHVEQATESPRKAYYLLCKLCLVP
jgi:hypothetical protein